MRALSFLHCLIEMLHAYSPPCLNKVHKTPNGRKESYGNSTEDQSALAYFAWTGPESGESAGTAEFISAGNRPSRAVFLKIMDESMAMLRELFQTKNRLALPMSGTGSAGMETCFANLIEPGDPVLIGVNGVFGTRMVERCSTLRRPGGYR